MKKRFIYIWMILWACAVFAQPPGEKNEKIEAAKIGFLTERIHLTQEQAKVFWPVFEEYSSKKREIRKSIKKMRHQCVHGTMNDSEILTEMRRVHQVKQNELDLEKEYFEKFVKILSAKQVAELYDAERDFTKMLLDKLGDGK